MEVIVVSPYQVLNGLTILHEIAEAAGVTLFANYPPHNIGGPCAIEVPNNENDHGALRGLLREAGFDYRLGVI